jgi:hypothetical protein
MKKERKNSMNFLNFAKKVSSRDKKSCQGKSLAAGTAAAAAEPKIFFAKNC